MRNKKMKALIIKTACMFALVVFVAGNSWSQNAEQLFQKGIMKEEGEGSLREAIDLYKSVADNTQADRALRAKALYQMGNCYEKLGQQEARGVYENLVANYTDQPELVTNAKRQLSKLNADRTGSDNSGIVIRQENSPGVDIAAYSPDGRYATYNDWDDPEIGVIDLKTGKKWEITKDGDYNSTKAHYPLSSIWSPDSKQVVYCWNVEDLEKDQSTYNYELHIIDRDGSNDQILFKNGNKSLLAADWSGSSILCIESNNSGAQPDSSNLVIIFENNGSKKVIANIGNPGNLTNINANFTEDGKYVIFRAPTEKGSENYDIFIVSADGGEVRPLITNKEYDSDAFRIPGTHQFVYFSNHAGTKDLWGVRIENGRIQGEPKVLKSDFHQTCRIKGVINNGTLFYSSARLNPDIFKARLNFSTGEVVNEPIDISRNSARKIIRAFWSPSFNYVACIIETPLITDSRLSPLKLVIQNTITGEEHEISTDLNTFLLFWWIEPQWAPDEKSILIKGVNKEGINGLFQIDVQTGKVSIYKAPMNYMWAEWRWLQFSTDGETQYFVTLDSLPAKQKILALTVKSGEQKILTEFNDWVDKVLLSTNGEKVAVQIKDSIWVLLSDGSGEKKKIESFEKLHGNPIGWSSDNKSIYVAKGDANKGLTLWELPLDNNSPKELFSTEKLKLFKGADGLKISHVGNEVYLTMQNGGRITEYWAVENIVQK
jgi:Tol biopolymer transport system component